MSSNHRFTDTYPVSRSSLQNSDIDLDSESDSSKSSRKSLEVTDPSLSTKQGGKTNSKRFNRRERHEQDLLIETNVGSSAEPPYMDETENVEATKEKPVTWRSLPRKDQLLVLTLARLSEPLTQTSLGSYIYYQLQSFDRTLPDSAIASQAGIIHAAFPFAQFLTAILWGHFADSEYGGRKRVIWIGLLGTMISIIGFGFSRSFVVAVLFRCLGGVLNGNIGVMRTMISEIVKEKKYQSRAFLVLPMTFNIGVIVGPILGGLLADPVASYPSVFGPGSRLGGKDGVYWMQKWPYALPNLMSAVFLLISALGVLFFLEETSELCKHRSDPTLRIGLWIQRHIFRRSIAPDHSYSAIPRDDYASLDIQMTPTSAHRDTEMQNKESPKLKRTLPFKRLWTRNLINTMLAHGLLAMHLGSFNSLWYIFLSAPRYDPSHPHPPGFHPHGLHFTGGLSLPPPQIGIALSILGLIGINLQILLYPNLSQRLGAALSYRIFLALFPLTYFLAPFLSIIPSSTAPPHGVTGAPIWMSITVVLFIQVLARTFALPGTAILVNNCSPHPSVLGTVHGIGQSMSSLTRTFGPIMFGWLMGKGLEIGLVGLAWWVLAGVAAVGCLVAQGVRDGDGHEILLEGEVRGKDGVVRREADGAGQ